MSTEGDDSVLQLNDPETALMPILPEDVLERISSYCFGNALGSLLAVSHTFHQHATRQFFLFVRLRHMEFPKPDKPDPFLFYSSMIRTDPSLAGACSRNSNRLGLFQESIPCRLLPQADHPAFFHTRHLMLDLHRYTDCKSMTPIFLPNLITLRIRSFPTGGKKENCWVHRSSISHLSYVPNPVSIPEGERYCNLLSELRPRRLIFALTHSNQSNPDPNFWQLSHPELIGSVKEVMMILRVGRPNILRDQPPRLRLFDEVPDTVQRLVIVISSCTPGWRKWGQGWGFDAGPIETYERELRPKDMRKYVAVACTGNAEVIGIIGLDTMVDVINANSIERGRREVREELVSHLVKRGWAGDKAEDRAEGLVFTSEV